MAGGGGCHDGGDGENDEDKPNGNRVNVDNDGDDIKQDGTSAS